MQFPSILLHNVWSAGNDFNRIYCSTGKHVSSTVSISATSFQQSESRELVRLLMRSFSSKEPIVRVLSKHVRTIRTDHCFLLFEELGKTDNWLQCLEVFRWMQKQRWYVADNGIYSKLISVMGKKGKIRMAMWLFSEMRNSGCRPDTSVYNALISAHLHSKDKAKALTKALSYLEKMKGLDRCLPNIVTYNILLRAFAQTQDVVQVNALFKDLEGSSIKPDIYTFNGVMDAYGKNAMIKEMESVLALMKSNGCKPDVITFNLLIDSYGKKQEFSKMEQVFKSLLKSKAKPTLPTFNSMIVNYGRARLKDNAERVFRKMVEMDYVPNSITHESLIMMYGFCGSVTQAKGVFDGMVKSATQVQVSTLNIMLDAYCRNGLPAQAHILLENTRAMRIMPNSATYKHLYRAYAKAGETDLLQQLRKRMESEGLVSVEKRLLEATQRGSKSETNSTDRRRGRRPSIRYL